MCLGFSWGACDVASLYGLMDESGDAWLSPAIACVALLIAGIAVWARKKRGDIRFGTVVRLAIVVCGTVLSSLALIYQELPALLYPLCNLGMIAGEMALIIFTVDICNKQGERVLPVFTLNFALFMGTSGLSAALFYAVQVLVEGQTAWLVISTAAVWAVLAAIPFLPSRSSDAIVLTSETLPENEGYEANIALRREHMAQRYALTPGEAVVLERLLQGKKREEIAEELNLSPWTVKARTSSIYKKCNVHSYKELIQLVSID